jgi:hypothetical protein
LASCLSMDRANRLNPFRLWRSWWWSFVDRRQGILIFWLMRVAQFRKVIWGPTDFKSGGLHEKHAVATYTWELSQHLFEDWEKPRKPVSWWSFARPSGYVLTSSQHSATKECRSPLRFSYQVYCCFIGARNLIYWLSKYIGYKSILVWKM